MQKRAWLAAFLLAGFFVAPGALAASPAAAPSPAKKPAAEKGIASWFRTKKKMLVAHRTLPLGTKLKVVAKNGKSVLVTVGDRGPFVKGRVVDLSSDAFKKLASLGTGLLHVTVHKVEKVAERKAAGQKATGGAPLKDSPSESLGDPGQ